ncbi:MAG: glutamine synthetase family protein [Candidatus Omnitrophica bacterium]|nr:glutamine synthetase family protein [Candidatus Omnitrophota bacterium]MBU4488823.1 glutamine synthetase family protein [Candidatus Omnitrophota bacterium]MCG2704713.1 glutamine synthetase family protein [Candidatus Omnitrophota bacterium]
MAKRTKEEILKLVKENDVKFIRLWFTDVMGQVKSFSITNTELEGALENGMGFDGSSITGYQDIEESDMIAMPDPDTFVILPWRPREKAVARMICDILNPDKTSYEGDPRHVLKRALDRAKKMGYDHFYLGPELEFFYFKNDNGTEILDKGGYFDLTTLDVASDLRRETVLALESMGIQIEYSHHEVAPSQHEVDMKYKDALFMADSVITYRVTVKEIASKFGVYATFMPKPIFGQNGSGMHTHQSLFKGSKNAFFDAKSKDNLSDVARCYIAGLLKHSKEICAIFAQTTNSYKRLVPGYEAPVYIAWSRRNRSALVRVPHYHPGKEQATRCEFRACDPACNPYLTFAAMLHAGLDGIEKNYKVPAPMEQNLYHLTDAERKEKGIETLPDSLGQAVLIAEKSELVRKVLGDHIFPRFIELKRKEWDDYRIQIPQYELDKYLSIL